MRLRAAVAAILAGLVCMSALSVAAAEAEAAKKRTRIAKKTKLKAFRSCAQVVRYGRRNVSRGQGAEPSPPTVLMPPPSRAFGAPGGGAEGAPQSGSPAPVVQEDSSTTNVQEQGVDEPDLVKSRGPTVFAIAGEQLHAVDTSGAAPSLLGSLPIEGYGHELLLFEGRALVFSRTFGQAEPGPAPAQNPDAPAFFGQEETLVSELDTSDPTAMRVVRTERLPARFVSARLAGRTARIVVSAPPPALYQENMRGSVDGWVPRRTLVNASGGRSSRRMAPCTRVSRAPYFSGLDLLTVLTVDMAKGLPAVDSDAIESGGEIVYGSPGSLYVATQRWTPQPSSPDAQPPERAFSAIHRFDASKPGESSYRASGQVPGYLLNQFAMSEHDGVLRVASTETPTWWGAEPEEPGQSYVTTLEQTGGVLTQLGQVSGLGKGERIYAVRFIDDAGFVVTFRQVDPLYTIDLSSPREPKVLGELKILGYSAYLHPLRNDLLLGIGQDATEQGQRQGAALSLFDIRDLRAPARLHQKTLEQYSSFEAEYDHHAFLWWRPTRLAVLPVVGQELVGAVGYNAGRSLGIVEAGRAEHAVADDYKAPIRRSLVVGGRLYTLSDEGLEQNSLADLAEEAWLALPRRP